MEEIETITCAAPPRGCGLPQPADKFREGKDADLCAPCRYGSVQVQGIGAHSGRAGEEALSRDIKAYGELRRDGMQPRHVRGSALLQAKAQNQIDVERGIITNNKIRKEIHARIADTPEVSTR